MNNQLYKVNGKMLNKEQYQKEIFLMLEKYNFADTSFLSGMLKVNEEQLREFLKDGIIAYVKTKRSMKMSEVCKTLKVKSDYVLELIEEGRIEMQGLSSEQLNDLAKAEEEAKKNNKRIKKMEMAKNLMNELGASRANNDSNRGGGLGGGFYSSGMRRR